MIAPLLAVLNSFRTQHRLQPYRQLSDSLSTRAQITQLVAEFDFPRTRLPACFHYVGPYFRGAPSDVSFPFVRLDGRPLVYAALGTTLEVAPELWTSIAQACTSLGLQLAIASATAPRDLPGDPIVVPYAPQEALLARAALFITNAGLNSALEALAHGVPTLAMPFVADQMGVAARIVYRGVGVARSRSLGHDIGRLLNDGSYRERSRAIGIAIQSSRGAEQAAEIIEGALTPPSPRKTA
jgi:UDP:flavonoid glycosyltransferase YjiC (YdhE family)